MLMLVTLAIELALAVLKVDNEPAKFPRSLGMLKKGRISELIAQQGYSPPCALQRARIGKVPLLAFAAPKLEFVTGC